MRGDHIVLYDADCGFCKRSLRRLLDRDRDHRLRSVAIQDPEADRLLAGIDPQQRLSSWHLAEPDGTVHSGGEALIVVLRLLPRGHRLAAMFARFPRATDAGYRWVARNRATISRITRPRRRDCAHC